MIKVRIGEILESRIKKKHQRCALIVALESSLSNQHQRCDLIVAQDFRSK